MAVNRQHLGHIDLQEELVSETQRQRRGGGHLIWQNRPELDLLPGNEWCRDGQDDGIRSQSAEADFDRKTRSAMVDERDRAVESNWQACRLPRDHGPVSFNYPPVDAAVGIIVAVLRGD